jgi:hypothetical protein
MTEPHIVHTLDEALAPLLPGIIPVPQAHQREQEAVQAAAGSAWNKRYPPKAPKKSKGDNAR